MDLFSPTAIKQVLSSFDAEPKRFLGQNFLISKGIVLRVIAAAQVKEEDVVLEVGPGLGSLTLELAKTAKRVLAIEKDETMIKILKKNLEGFSNVEVVKADARYFDLSLVGERYKVVANIPYYLTAPLIRRFLEAERRPQSITLVVQKEVAQRITAKPPHFNLLAASVQFYAKPALVSLVLRGSFWPQPRVDSAILNVIPSEQKDQKLIKNYFRIVKAGFSHPRKQLLNNLSPIFKEQGLAGAFLKENGIDQKARAETLGTQEWIKLAIACTMQ